MTIDKQRLADYSYTAGPLTNGIDTYCTKTTSNEALIWLLKVGFFCVLYQTQLNALSVRFAPHGSKYFISSKFIANSLISLLPICSHHANLFFAFLPFFFN
jgi:hypothetical protein